MDSMAILGLAWSVNLFTECKTPEVSTHLTELIVKIIKHSESRFSKKQQRLVIEAIKLSAEWHKGIYRKCGIIPYVVHPLEVALFIFESGIFDFHLTIAAILHDVVEDEKNPQKRYLRRKKITKLFGSTVRRVVELLTKSRRIHERRVYFEKMRFEKRVYVLMRALFAKMADCAKNTETFDVFDKKRRDEKIEEILWEYPLLLDVLVKAINDNKLRLAPRKKNNLKKVAGRMMAIIAINLSRY